MGDMGSMCCCGPGFFWEWARGTTISDITRLIGYSSASTESSYAAESLQIDVFDDEFTVTPVYSSGEHLWGMQLVDDVDRYFYRFTTSGDKVVDGPYIQDFSPGSRADAIKHVQGEAISLAKPTRTATTTFGSGFYPSDGTDNNHAAVGGSFYAFYLPEISPYLASVTYSTELFSYPYNGQFPQYFSDALPPSWYNSYQGTAYGWDGIQAIRKTAWHVEGPYLGFTNWEDLSDLHDAGYTVTSYGVPSTVRQDGGEPVDTDTGEFFAAPALGALPAYVYRLGWAPTGAWDPNYHTWERYQRDAANYLLLAGSPHTTKHVLAVRQELISDDVTLTNTETDSSSFGGATAGDVKTYTRDWTTQHSLVIGTFDPITCGIVEDDVDEPIRVLHLLSEEDHTKDYILRPLYLYNSGTDDYATFQPEVDTRVWQQVLLTLPVLPTVNQWDISRNGERWCARLDLDPGADPLDQEIIINGVVELTPTSPPHPDQVAGSLATERGELNAWAQAYNDDTEFDPTTDWPVPYEDWPNKTLAVSVDDEITNYNKALGYRWYTFASGVVMVVDGPADLDRAPQSPTENIDAVLYFVERSYLEFSGTIEPYHRFRFEFWGAGVLKGTTYSRPRRTASGSTPVLGGFMSHGEYVYLRTILWHQDDNDNLGYDLVIRPRTLEYYGSLGGHPDLTGVEAGNTPWFNLFRFPLPHNDWTVVDPQQVTWLPLNPEP